MSAVLKKPQHRPASSSPKVVRPKRATKVGAARKLNSRTGNQQFSADLEQDQAAAPQSVAPEADTLPLDLIDPANIKHADYDYSFEQFLEEYKDLLGRSSLTPAEKEKLYYEVWNPRPEAEPQQSMEISPPEPEPEKEKAETKKKNPGWVERQIIKAKNIIRESGDFGEQLIDTVERAQGVWRKIVARPSRFFGHLKDALIGGFTAFQKNILFYLKNALFDWLFGAVGKNGLTLPTSWTPQAIGNFVLEVLGLTYESFRKQIVKIKGGEQVIGAIENTVGKAKTVFVFIQRVAKNGLKGIQEQLDEAVKTAKTQLEEKVQVWVAKTLMVTVVTELVALATPFGAILKAIIKGYKMIQTLISKLSEIVKFLSGIFEGIESIANGVITKAVNAVKESLGRGLSLALKILARLFFGDISKPIKEVLGKVQKPAKKAMKKIAVFIVDKGKAVFGAVKKGLGNLKNWWKTRVKFTTKSGDEHHVYFKGSRKNRRLIIESDPKPYKEYVDEVEKQIKNLTGPDKQKAKEALKRATPIANRIDKTKKDLTRRNQDKSQAMFDDVNALADQIEIIANLLTDKNTVPTVIKYGGVTGEGAGTSANGEFITQLNDRQGSTPLGGQGGKIWTQIQKRNVTGTAVWIRGHLMNENLGGQGRSFNLTPLTGSGSSKFGLSANKKIDNRKNANSAHLTTIETPVKNVVKAEKDEDRKVVRYKVTAVPGTHNKRAGTTEIEKLRDQARKNNKTRLQNKLDNELTLRLYEEKHIAKGLTYEAYTLKHVAGKWKKDKDIGPGTGSIPNPLPDDANKTYVMPNTDLAPGLIKKADYINTLQ